MPLLIPLERLLAARSYLIRLGSRRDVAPRVTSLIAAALVINLGRTVFALNASDLRNCYWDSVVKVRALVGFIDLQSLFRFIILQNKIHVATHKKTLLQ